MVILAVLALSGTVLMGCGGDAPKVPVVKVELREYKVKLNKQTVEPGKLILDIADRGVMRHELWVIRTDRPVFGLPTDENDIVIESSPGMRVVAKQKPLLPHTTAELSVNLSAGRYVLLCNLAGHYQRGMAAELYVTATR